MDVILISADLFELNVIAEGDFLRDLDNREREVIGEQGFAVFDGKDNVVVSFIDIVVGMFDGHASILPWKPRVSKPSSKDPAAEPRGNPLRVLYRNFATGI